MNLMIVELEITDSGIIVSIAFITLKYNIFVFLIHKTTKMLVK